MSGWWNRLNRWLDHPAARIRGSEDDHRVAIVVHLAAMLEEQARATSTPSAPPPAVPAKPAAGALDKGLVTDLCNRLHQLSRAVKKAKEQGGTEADRLKGHIDRLEKTLGEHSIAWEDLTGQAYDPGRADFEPLGEPQETPGLSRKIIIQCERPVIRLEGKVIQSARGIVGKPVG
jgi:hypothetical protein